MVLPPSYTKGSRVRGKGVWATPKDSKPWSVELGLLPPKAQHHTPSVCVCVQLHNMQEHGAQQKSRHERPAEINLERKQAMS